LFLGLGLGLFISTQGFFVIFGAARQEKTGLKREDARFGENLASSRKRKRKNRDQALPDD
jgi:hypothetical protein